MTVSVLGEIMAAGRWAADVIWTPDVYEKLYDRTNKRARLYHAEIHDAADDTLVCPPMVLRRIAGDEKGLTIGGPGPLWHLGTPGVGPAIRDREYVSGLDKLSNGSFEMLDDDGTATYWRRVSQESRWTFEVGKALCAGGLDADDIIEPDIDQFPTRPGHAYRLRVTDLIGTGQFRARIVFDGRFDPPNLLTNGDFDEGPGGGWGTATYLEIVPAVFFGGYYALRVVPIPKPQLVTGPDFSTGWTLGDTMTEHDDFLWIGETPKPQYLPHGYAVDDFTSSPYVTFTDVDPTKAVSGSGYYHQIGPIGQHMPITNHSFESGLTGWVQAAGAWSTSSATYVDGANSATTGGVAGGALKSLQADAGPGGGVDPFTWAVGEEWQFDGDLCSGTKGTSDEADGEAHLRVYLVDVNYPANDSHLELVSLRGDDLDAAEWHHGQQRYSVQADKVSFVPMATIYGHENGSWYVDNFRATRIRGNNTGIYSDEFTAIPNQRYNFDALFATSDVNIGGTITLRLIFKVAAGGIDVETTTTLSPTAGQWKSLHVEGTCPKGYDTVQAAIDGDDIVGGSFYVDSDYTLLQKSDNNTDRTDGTPFAVVPAQRYAGGATIVRQAFIEKGTVRVGVVLSGPAVSDEIISVEHSFGEDTGAATRVTFDITPKDGYDTATPFVLAKDLAGGDGTNDIVAITAFTVEKSDNNSDAIAHDSIAVTPERTYRWTQKFASDENLQRGTIQLVARCVHPLAPTFPDQTFPSSAMKPAADESFQTLELSFTPPSGYTSVVCSIVATDVEGSNIFVDKGELRDTDGTTVVFDATVTDPAGATLDVNATAPTGAESVRCQLIAPAGTSSWVVGAAALSRTGVTPATGDAIVAELLTHPRTHAQLVVAGNVTCPEVIPSDWQIVNMNDREALDHYCTVVSDPPREYRFQNVAPPTIDVGVAEDVCTDHPDIVLLPEDIDVQDLDAPESDVTERADVIVLLGNERTTAGGQRALIRATADVPGGTEYGYLGDAVERTRFLSDGTVDHHAYARARSTDMARQEAEPPLVLPVKLSGKNTRPGLREGDWLRAYHPEAGVEDHTDANAVVIEGRTVYPRKLRVLTMERVLGPSHYIKMRKPDGTFVQFRQPDGTDGPNLPGVLWSSEDAAALTIGDRLPEWRADPQGKAAGLQYLEDRKSRPR